jgi:hypothetical protein
MKLLLTQYFYDFLQVISKIVAYAQEPRRKFILWTKKAAFSTGLNFVSAAFFCLATIFQSP